MTAHAPTLDEFVRHARLFGLEDVVETARAYLAPPELAALELEVAQLGAKNGRPAATRQRRTTTQLQEQVRALRDRGMVPGAIADTLNISDRRTESLLRQATTPNGGRKGLSQAKDSAAKAVGHVGGKARRA
jgi:hypothetical protein